MKAAHGYTVDSGNPERLELIKQLKAKEGRIWKSLAERLSGPRRKRREVTLSALSKLGGGGIFIVPGIVLGSGEARGRITVAAWRFSASARGKIEAAGGKCMSIRELAGKNPEPSALRVVG